MIEHLRGREQALAALGWDRAGGRMDCPGLSSQRRFHPASVLSLLRCRRGMHGVARFVKALVDRKEAVESEWPVMSTEAGKIMPDFREGDLSGAWS